jgi:hypothetical protein
MRVAQSRSETIYAKAVVIRCSHPPRACARLTHTSGKVHTTEPIASRHRPQQSYVSTSLVIVRLRTQLKAALSRGRPMACWLPSQSAKGCDVRVERQLGHVAHVGQAVVHSACSTYATVPWTPSGTGDSPLAAAKAGTSPCVSGRSGTSRPRSTISGK